MRVTLSTKDRFLALGLLPQEGNILTLRTVRDVQGKLALTAKEIETYEVKQTDDGRVTWRQDMPAAEIELSAAEAGLIRDALAKREKDQKLTLEHMDLYDTFTKANTDAKDAKG